MPTGAQRSGDPLPPDDAQAVLGRLAQSKHLELARAKKAAVAAVMQSVLDGYNAFDRAAKGEIVSTGSEAHVPLEVVTINGKKIAQAPSGTRTIGFRLLNAPLRAVEATFMVNVDDDFVRLYAMKGTGSGTAERIGHAPLGDLGAPGAKSEVFVTAVMSFLSNLLDELVPP